MVVLIILLPLLASIITGLYNKILSAKVASIITSIAMIISSLISIYVFYRVSVYGDVFYFKIMEWLNIGRLKANFAIYIDQLAAIMLVVVTIVSSVVHIYSIGYMDDDQNLPRFMSYLSFFTVFMLLLVTSDNLLQLFFGWEGVGLCSYLLIGFWYKKDSANFASVKAFVVNRVGDLSFIIGIIFIYHYFGSVEFAYIFPRVTTFAPETMLIFGCKFYIIEIICLLLFIGCMGKSAQIGLHVWLPDAMEGPTPVSALIHAATMVTAGVFLIARCSYLFEYAPNILDFVVVIGSITCVFASIIAIAQNDIKKIIAYSTCSQLGYMFLACGLSIYHGGIFHLYTHAFFKAMLFLAAGSVIHSTGEQDITKMGGLKKQMPITYILFWIGSLAIMGIYPFSGYFSKDFILNSAYLSNTSIGDFAYICGIITALCTAVYSSKIIFKVFHGSPYMTGGESTHESPYIMNMPLVLLAIGSVVSGYFADKILNITIPETGFFKNSIFMKSHELGSHHLPFGIEVLPLIVVFVGGFIGYLMCFTRISYFMKTSYYSLYRLVSNKFYFDEIYNLVFVKSNDKLARLMAFLDKNLIDFLGPTSLSVLSYKFSRKITMTHNGLISFYALGMVIGTIVAISIIVFKYVV